MKYKANDVVQIDRWHDTYRYYGKFGPYAVLEVVEKVEKNDKNASEINKVNFKEFGPHYVVQSTSAKNFKLLLYERELE